jgi:[ribosomal protein S18]-alanine N-acetyltransferase
VTLDLVVTRLAGPEELDGVLAIDRESFSRPWTRQMYEEDLKNPQSRIWIARDRDALAVGYCAAWLVLDELHINNVAVAQVARRKGVASALVARALGEAGREGATAATLEVRRANTAARQLYERLGFRQAGERARYYDQPADDALILWAQIQGFGDSPGA